MCRSMHVRMHVSFVCMDDRMYVCTYVCMYVRTYVRMYVRMYVYIHRKRSIYIEREKERERECVCVCRPATWGTRAPW